VCVFVILKKQITSQLRTFPKQAIKATTTAFMAFYLPF